MYYKLTNQKMQTYNDFQWEMNKWVKTDGKGELYTEHWLHCYNHPLLAVIFNSIHANVKNPRLFKINVRGKKLTDNGVKFGFTQMQLVKEIKLPEISLTRRIVFGILCAKKVYRDKKWNKWADNWLSGKDRSENAAAGAAAAGAAAAGAVAGAAAADAAYAADTAGVYAADTAAYAAYAADTAAYAAAAYADAAYADAAYADAAYADAAYAADTAAGAADTAAGAAVYAVKSLNLIKIVKKAMKFS